MTKNPIQEINEWKQQFRQTLQVDTSWKRPQGQFHLTLSLRYMPQNHSRVKRFLFQAISHSKQTVKTILYRRARHALYKHGCVMYKHPQPCSMCRYLKQGQEEQVETSVFEDSMTRLNTHCQKLGISEFLFDEKTRTGFVVASHPVFRTGWTASYEQDASEARGTIINELLSSVDEQTVANALHPYRAKPTVKLHMRAARVLHIHTHHRGDWTRAKKWMSFSADQALVFDTEWDQKDQLVVLSFCRDGQHVMIVRLHPTVWDRGQLDKWTRLLFPRVPLLCMGRSMEARALQRLGVQQHSQLVDVAAVIAAKFPGLSDRAGLIRNCRWFLGLDLTPYKLDFRQMHRDGVSWHRIFADKKLLAHAVSDCLALWHLWRHVTKF